VTQVPTDVSPFRLDGQAAFVTGATGGLGAAIVVALARAGADIALADLPNRRAAADALVADIVALGRRAVAIPIDVTSVASIQAAVSTAEDHLGPIGVAVANAGVNIRKPGLDLTESEWDTVLDINLKGVFFTCQAVGRRMVPRGHGSIIALASQHGVVATPRSPAYSAAKAGVVNLVRSLAVDWAPRGVRVNAVGPTFIETDLTREYLGDPDVRADIVGRIPLGRLGTPHEVAHAVVYLASPAASLVTGTCLMADGGWTAV
jgi:NAD(P)-dependent dehydrogenase (short-subunit alcohol dehydrogenase family)